MPDGPITAHRRAAQNRLYTRLLVAAFGLLLVTPLAFLVQYLGVWVWLLLFAGASLGSGLTTALLATALAAAGLAAAVVARVLVARRSLPETLGAIPIEAEAGAPILRRIENLSLAAGIPTPRAFLLRSPQANAFATGATPERAALVLTEGLLHAVDRRALDSILAHELAHIRNQDMRLNSTLAAIVRTVRLPAPIYWLFLFGTVSTLAAALLTGAGAEILGFQGELLDAIRSGEAFGTGAMRWAMTLLLWINLAAPVTIAVWPPLARFIQSQVARQREFLADAEGATLTRDPIGLALALARISSVPPRAQGARHDATPQVPGVAAATGAGRLSGIEHLCILPIGRGTLAAWFPTHPSVQDRVAALNRMAPREAEAAIAEAPNPEFASAATAIIAAHRPPDSRARVAASPFLFGFAVGVGVQTVLWAAHLMVAADSPEVLRNVRLLAIASPWGIAGAVAARFAASRSGRRLWWPSALMFVFGQYVPLTLSMGAPIPISLGGLVLTYLVSLSEPLAGAALGRFARGGLAQLLRRIREAKGGTGREPLEVATTSRRALDGPNGEPARPRSVDPGAPFRPKTKCPKCGATIAEGDWPCVWCGFRPQP